MKDIRDKRREDVFKYLLKIIKKDLKHIPSYDMSFLDSRVIKLRLNPATKKLLVKYGSGNYFEFTGRDKVLNKITVVPEKSNMLDEYGMAVKLNFKNDKFEYSFKFYNGGTFYSDEFDYLRNDMSWAEYRNLQNK